MKLPDFLEDEGYGVIRLTGHRIGLHDVIYFYREGYSAEALGCQFPTLSLAEIHKVIAFYLENQKEVDTYVDEHEADCEKHRTAAAKGPTLKELRQRLARMRKAEAS
jgi:uncharacterized protein (DUF433 family)